MRSFVNLKIVFTLMLLAAPAYADAAIVPSCAEGCGFPELIQLLDNVIDFAILAATLIAPIMFAVAGIYYVTSGGDPGKISTAHTIFTNTLIGFVIVLAAWVVLKAIVLGLGASGFVIEYVDF